MKLDFSQRKSLSNYCGNLSIAWLAAGVIGPYVSRQTLGGVRNVVVFSVLMAMFFLTFMSILVKKGR